MAAALLGSEDVSSAVVSQPALPFRRFLLTHAPGGAGALGISPSTIKRAAARAKNLPAPSLLGFRYLRDSHSPQERLDRLASFFGSAFEGKDLCEADEVCPTGYEPLPTMNSSNHSVLIQAGGEELSLDNARVFQVLADFLKRHSAF